MSETIKGLPEFDAQYKNRMDRESMHDLTKRNTVEQWERIACRERQLRAAITRAELAEAELAKRDATIAELQAAIRSDNELFTKLGSQSISDSATARSVVALLRDLHALWDIDKHMKVGKLLLAAMGDLPGYSPETDDLAKRLCQLAERNK